MTKLNALQAKIQDRLLALSKDLVLPRKLPHSLWMSNFQRTAEAVEECGRHYSDMLDEVEFSVYKNTSASPIYVAIQIAEDLLPRLDHVGEDEPYRRICTSFRRGLERGFIARCNRPALASVPKS